MGTVSKTMLIGEVADAAQITKPAAAEAIDEFLVAIRTHAGGGHKVVLQGFGTFEMKTRAAHTGRNPGTGLAIEVPETTRLTFKASKAKA